MTFPKNIRHLHSLSLVKIWHFAYLTLILQGLSKNLQTENKQPIL